MLREPVDHDRGLPSEAADPHDDAPRRETMKTTPITRRDALAIGLGALSAAALSACGGADAPASDPYVAIALPTPVSQHTAVALGGAQVAVVGGSRGLAALSASVDLLDGRAGIWSARAQLSTGRAQACAVLVGGALLFVHGGARSLAGSRTAEWVDLARGITTPAPPSPSRMHHTATLLRDGRILVAGGRSAEGHAGGVSPTLELWDPDGRRWRFAARTMQQPRHGHTATLLRDGSVLFVGGYTADGMAASAERFDPATETTTLYLSPLLARAGHAAALQPDGEVLLAGGEHGALALPAAPGALRLSFDPWAVEPVEGVPALAQTAAAGVARSDGLLQLFGGTGADGHAVATALGIGSALRMLPPMPAPRAGHTATLLDGDDVLLIGGEHGGRLLATALRMA